MVTDIQLQLIKQFPTLETVLKGDKKEFLSHIEWKTLFQTAVGRNLPVYVVVVAQMQGRVTVCDAQYFESQPPLQNFVKLKVTYFAIDCFKKVGNSYEVNAFSSENFYLFPFTDSMPIKTNYGAKTLKQLALEACNPYLNDNGDPTERIRYQSLILFETAAHIFSRSRKADDKNEKAFLKNYYPLWLKGVNFISIIECLPREVAIRYLRMCKDVIKSPKTLT